MKTYCLIIILLWTVLYIVNCIPSNRKRRKSETTEKFCEHTGVSIAVDYLIQKYEREHQQFYEREVKDDSNLMWPDLEKKDLSNYCRKYLQHAIPSRKNDSATGHQIVTKVHYKKENICFSNEIVVVQCKITYRHHLTCYYMTRAPDQNCVYSLKHGENKLTFTIINKYCDFENKPLINSSLKYKLEEIINKRHPRTGQFIAKDEYLLEYELEHQRLLEVEGDNGLRLQWSHALLHPDLDSYCRQYIIACVPRRIQWNIKGKLKIQKLHYHKLNTNKDIEVTTVLCLLHNMSVRSYYVTRAPETYCVYALLRQGSSPSSPMVIVFKYCDFEHPNDAQTTSQDYKNLDTNVIPKTE